MILMAMLFFCGHLMHGGRLASSLCSILIVLYSLLDTPIYSASVFIEYLLLDYFYREDVMPNEIVVHHIITGCLTLIGIHAVSFMEDKSVGNYIIVSLLQMELTTPFLHLSFYLNTNHHFKLAAYSYSALLLTWIPFRLIYPAICIYKLYMEITPSFLWFYLIGPIICATLALQAYWFYKLITIAIKKLI